MLFFLISATLVFADERDRNPMEKDRGIYAEYFLEHNGGKQEVVVLYRVQYNALLFNKDNGEFNASYSVSIELTDTTDKVLSTEIVDNTIHVKKFEETISDSSVQGLVRLAFTTRKALLKINFSDASTNREIRRIHLRIPADKHSTNVAESIAVVDYTKDSTSTLFQLCNYGGVVPFNSGGNTLIMSTSKIAAKEVSLIVSNEDTSISLQSSKEVAGKSTIDSAAGKVWLKIIPDDSSKTYIFPEFSRALIPGHYDLKLTWDTQKDSIKKPIDVVWLGMPRILRNQELSYTLLNLVDSLYDNSDVFSRYSKKSPISIFKFWAKYDPTPRTAYNEQMAEFYRRADIATEKFSTIKGNNGAETHRGEIFIKFGQPTSIERVTTKGGKVAEIWKYLQLKKTFNFIDYTGSGNFEIVNSL